MYLVLIETSGNQRYIFSTNKLRENLGASELTYRAGTQWVLEAVSEVGGPRLWDENGENLRGNLLNQEFNQPLELSGVSVEVIVATSGKALLLVKEPAIGKAIIQRITTRALKRAPDLDICGVISESFDWETKPLWQVNCEVHKLLEEVRSQRPGQNLRFLRLPIVDECATSGLPASIWDRKTPPGEPPAARAAASIAKRNSGQSALRRMAELLRHQQATIHFPENIRILEEKFDEIAWLAVIHADGNGLGEIFLRFHKHVGATTAESNRAYVTALRSFSIALDICTERAFLQALNVFSTQDERIPLIPLILGGDDLTVVCDGKVALRFTREFLVNFERETALHDPEHLHGIVPRIAQQALRIGRLSICAGITIIKPHFPFSIAYKLSEQLLKSAKNVKTKIQHLQKDQPLPCSALDFHILYDTSVIDLDSIRKKLRRDEEKTLLYRRPYVVTPQEALGISPGFNWSQAHRWETLLRQADTLLAKDEDGQRILPNSQMHDLRSGLFLGYQGANDRFSLICERYRSQGIEVFEESPNSLFRAEPESDLHTTGLLDALDAATFLACPRCERAHDGACVLPSPVESLSSEVEEQSP